MILGGPRYPRKLMRPDLLSLCSENGGGQKEAGALLQYPGKRWLVEWGVSPQVGIQTT